MSDPMTVSLLLLLAIPEGLTFDPAAIASIPYLDNRLRIVEIIEEAPSAHDDRISLANDLRASWDYDSLLSISTAEAYAIICAIPV